MYTAYICSIRDLRKHSNADRLQVGKAHGYSVIVDLSTQDGELGIVFPEGGQINRCFAEPNRLYQKHPDTQEPMGGYLDKNGRVRSIKLRGEESEALWLPISSLATLDPKNGIAKLFEGDEIQEFGGQVICQRYVTPQQLRAMQSRDPVQKKQAAEDAALAKHYDTPQLRHTINQLPRGRLIITEKLHGTSGRTGNVMVQKPFSLLKRAWNWLAPKALQAKPQYEWRTVSGTRNCIVKVGAPGEKGQGYRVAIHEALAGLLPVGMTLFYEVVGFSDTGGSIMAPHVVGDLGDKKLEKQLKKQYGDGPILYRYACHPASTLPYRVFVYRITNGALDMEWDEVVFVVNKILNPALAEKGATFELELPPVLYDGHTEDRPIMELANELTRGDSTLDHTHPREGVCLRVETGILNQDGGTVSTLVHKSVKHKSFVFCALEGIARNDPEFTDEEEMS